MGDHDDFLAFETAEHIVSTPPPPAVSNVGNMLPPRSEARSNRSDAWNHFTVVPGTEKKARCNYCSSLIKYDNGTSAMRAHLQRCKNNPNKDASKRQRSTSSSTSNVEGHVNSSPAVAKIDSEDIRKALVKMFIGMEMPFRRVEHELFREFMRLILPWFKLPSRTTIARDVLKLWKSEKTMLKDYISQHCQRVCLTTDMWTSSQNYSYMCITAHFVDNN